MILLSYALALIVVLGSLSLLTAAGSALIARTHPPKGKSVSVEGAKLYVDQLGGRSDDDTAVVLVHGASNNMEDMRIALGAALADRYRTILIDRPVAAGASGDRTWPLRNGRPMRWRRR